MKQDRGWHLRKCLACCSFRDMIHVCTCTPRVGCSSWAASLSQRTHGGAVPKIQCVIHVLPYRKLRIERRIQLSRYNKAVGHNLGGKYLGADAKRHQRVACPLADTICIRHHVSTCMSVVSNAQLSVLWARRRTELCLDERKFLTKGKDLK
jgi:hypothetical protein